MNVVYWVFPETRGLGLEEVAQVFGEDVTAGYEAGEKAVGQVDEYRDEGRRSLSKAEVEHDEYRDEGRRSTSH